MAEQVNPTIEEIEAKDAAARAEAIKAAEEKAAAELAAHVAAVKATEAEALAKSDEQFPEYHADK